MNFIFNLLNNLIFPLFTLIAFVLCLKNKIISSDKANN